LDALVLKSTGSWYQVETLDGAILEARIRGKFRLVEKDISNPIAVGDLVRIEEDPNFADTAQIVEIYNRKNYIIRKSNKLSSKRQILASNLDLGLMVASLVAPSTSRGFIDRFLACCEAYHIPAAIFFNKTDLLEDDGIELSVEMSKEYSDLGYTTFVGSATTGHGADELKAFLFNKTTLLAGHSGVGKSTLLNKLYPESLAKVGAISETHLKGKHTTTFAQMYVIDKTRIIDTPGIRDFGLVDIVKQELAHTFPEFRHHMSACKFNDCLHINEPECAVKNAVEQHTINPERYYSYLSMYHNEDSFN